jgi:hypothetical protein
MEFSQIKNNFSCKQIGHLKTLLSLSFPSFGLKFNHYRSIIFLICTSCYLFGQLPYLHSLKTFPISDINDEFQIKLLHLGMHEELLFSSLILLPYLFDFIQSTLRIHLSESRLLSLCRIHKTVQFIREIQLSICCI